MDEKQLLIEWRSLLGRQRALVKERGNGDRFDGMVGAMVEKDDLALEYQAIRGKLWDIRLKLFGVDLLFPSID